MDEAVEIIPTSIPRDIYEKQVHKLIETLLLIDEERFPEESQPKGQEAA